MRMRGSAADASRPMDQFLLRQMQVLIRQMQALSERVDTSECYIAAIVFANQIAAAASEIEVEVDAADLERAGA